MSGIERSQSEHTDGMQLSLMISRAKVDLNASDVGELLDLYRNYLNLLAQTQINKKLNAKVSASDIVQETFLDAHRDFGKFKGETEAELIAWLRKILVRNLYDEAKHAGAQRRDYRREQSLEAAMDRSSMHLAAALGDNATSPSKIAAKREQAVIVADAIARLPDEYRFVMIQRQVHGIPFAQIGNELGKSSGAVRMIWLRALESLKKHVEQP